MPAAAGAWTVVCRGIPSVLHRTRLPRECLCFCAGMRLLSRGVELVWS